MSDTCLECCSRWCADPFLYGPSAHAGTREQLYHKGGVRKATGGDGGVLAWGGAAHTQWVDIQKMNAINTDNCAFQQVAAASNTMRNLCCKTCRASIVSPTPPTTAESNCFTCACCQKSSSGLMSHDGFCRRVVLSELRCSRDRSVALFDLLLRINPDLPALSAVHLE